MFMNFLLFLLLLFCYLRVFLDYILNENLGFLKIPQAHTARFVQNKEYPSFTRQVLVQILLHFYTHALLSQLQKQIKQSTLAVLCNNTTQTTCLNFRQLHNVFAQIQDFRVMQLKAFQTIVFPSSSGSSSRIILRLVTLLYPEDEEIRLLQMSVAIYKFTRYKIPEDVNLYFNYCVQGST